MFELTEILEKYSPHIIDRISREEYQRFLWHFQHPDGNQCISSVISLLTPSEIPLVYAAATYQSANGSMMTVAQCAAALNVSAPAVSRTLRNLEQKGYVQRITDPDDRRSVRVSVTDSGAEALTQCIIESLEVVNEALSDFTDEELRMMVKLHCKFKENMSRVITEKKAMKKGAEN